MNIRESRHTAMLFDRRYQNIDTGKFDTDKLHTLNNLSLVDLMTEESGEYYSAPIRYRHKRERRIEHERQASIYNFPKHVPKDNGFDEELRREKEIAFKKKKEDEKIARAERRAKYEKFKEERINEMYFKSDEYAKQLLDAERRVARYDSMIVLNGPDQGKLVSNVRPNVWKPK